MPSVTRVFAIPLTTNPTGPEAMIVLREPSLTGDNLGHKTWAASYLLAKRLALLKQYLPQFSEREDPRVLELGGGTGLVGISAAAILSAPVALTDLPEICSNLAYNCQANESTIASNGGSTNIFPLDWSEPSTYPSHKYDLILAADSLYSPGHPALLANTIATLLAKMESARVVVEFPVREAYKPEIEKFRELMVEKGLDLVKEGDDVGYDDWDDGAKEVVCWWGIWGWK
jgi:predicted nicotinamide N-methyase